MTGRLPLKSAILKRRLPSCLVLALCLAALNCSRPPKAEPAARNAANRYVDAKACASCHGDISKNYARTGMARSFRAAVPADGPGTDYVMGSGNHVKTYLRRTARNTLVELPVAWYAEKGGYRAPNPGFDTGHPPARRKVGYDCMFCHNAYPRIPAGHEEAGAEPVFSFPLPEGIDCQRCHGPGGNHVAAPGKKGSIFNPRGKMEVCLQCHLETTSFALPNAIRRFDRGPFSYTPGEPLSRFILFFDHAPGTGHDDKFEIVSSAYRLRQSRCFLESQGRLTCTTCHNPHDIPRGAAAVERYSAVCKTCHPGDLGKAHPADPDCTACHMPKRRTEDVVHAVMTDHRIMRRAPPNPLAERAEIHGAQAEYHGTVVPYLDSDPLYTAFAQVSAKSNTEAGIPLLEAAIAQYRPDRPEFHIQLGDAWRDAGHPGQAIPAFEQALRQRPGSALILRRLAEVRKDPDLLRRAVQAEPENAEAWYDLGLMTSDEAALRKAAELDPDLADAPNTLGAVLAEKGNAAEAETAFAQALRIDPNHPDAHANLANLLSSAGRLADAGAHFERAVRLAPDKPLYRFNYAVTLARQNRYPAARQQLEAALRADANFAEAHDLLGGLFEQQGRNDAALKEYREAVRLRPSFGKARLDLGALLAARRDFAGAAEQFRAAAADPNPGIRQQAQQALAGIRVQ